MVPGKTASGEAGTPTTISVAAAIRWIWSRVLR
jgi:hypothetical protein